MAAAGVPSPAPARAAPGPPGDTRSRRCILAGSAPRFPSRPLREVGPTAADQSRDVCKDGGGAEGGISLVPWCPGAAVAGSTSPSL